MKRGFIFCWILLILVGCGPSNLERESADNANRFPKIGLSLLTLDNPYFRQVAESMEAEGVRLNCRVIVRDGDFDNNRQQAQIRQFIKDGVQAIVLSPCDAVAIAPALQEATAKGIPVFTIDTACLAPEASVVTHIATDNYGGGKQAAYAMIEALGDAGGKIAIVDYKKLESVVLRVTGFREVIARHNVANPEDRIEVIDEITGGAVAEGGFQAGAELIRRHSELDGVFGINDPSALGVRSALEKAKRDDVVVVGFDGSLKGRKAIRAGRLYASPVQYPGQLGVEAVRAVVRHWRGEALPTEMLIPTSLYRKADVERDAQLKGWLF